MSGETWILAIDFGTSFTVAAVKVEGRKAEVVEIAGERRMPSIVLTEDDGIMVGRVAESLSATNPSRTLRAPKSRLGDQAPVVLGGRPYQIADLVAGVLRYVSTDVIRQMGSPPSEVRLTHPASWNRPRLNRLLEAAAKADLTNVSLVAEPVGAALSYASEIGVPAGSHVAVYDLGGGTFDSAVVTATGTGGFTIVGRPGGDQTIGGELFDEVLFNHIGEQLPPGAWYSIQVGEDPEWQQAGAALRNEVRRAKEALSSHPYAELLIPLPDGMEQLRVAIDEYEELISPYIEETITLLARTIENAGLATGDLEAVYLVGGASRAPIVERAVTARYPGVTVSRRGDPKTSVALGAATAVRLSASTPVPGDHTTQDASPATSPNPLVMGPPPGVTPPPGGPPTPAPPIGRSSLPPTAPPPSGPPPTAGPGTDPPRGVGSVPPGVPPTVVPTSGPPTSPPPTALRTSGPVPVTPPATSTGSGSRTKLYALAGAAAAVILLVVGFVVLGGGGDEGSAETERTDRSSRADRTDPDETDPTETDPVETGPVETVASTTPDTPLPASATLPPVTAPPITASGPVARTPEELVVGVLSVDDVNAQFANEFAEFEVVPTTDQFCGVVPPVLPVSQAASGFVNSDGTAELYSAIDHYATEDDALTMIAQDQSFTDTCPLFTEEIGGIEYQVILAPFGDVVASSLEGEFAAVLITGLSTDGGSSQFSGFIVEKLDGPNIVTISGYRYDTFFDDVALEQFLSLMTVAFDKAVAVR